MAKLAEFQITRVLNKDQADEVVGLTVEGKEPNVNEAGLYRDAETGEAILLYAPYPAPVTPLRRCRVDVGTIPTPVLGNWRRRAAALVKVQVTPTTRKR